MEEQFIEMPAPDALVKYPDGSFGPAMFHYASEGDSLLSIAYDAGFDLQCLELQNDGDADPGIFERYSDGDAECIAEWRPQREGWRLVGVGHGEEDAVALFVRPIADISAANYAEQTGHASP